MLLLMKKHTDTLIEQTKTKAQETLEFKINKQMITFSFSPPINLVEKGNWLLAVTSFEATNSVFRVINEKNSFSVSTPSHWNSDDGEELINKLNKLLGLRSENDIEVHVKEFEKRGSRIERFTKKTFFLYCCRFSGIELGSIRCSSRCCSIESRKL